MYKTLPNINLLVSNCYSYLYLLSIMKNMSKMMKYIHFNKSNKKFEIRTTDIPPSNPDETLIKINATCINRLDILEKKGLYKTESPDDIMGVEFVGQKVDPVTLEIKEPDTYYGSIVKNGTYAEYVACKTDHLIKFDFGGSIADYAAVPEAFITAHQLTSYYSDISKDDIVYINAGASGVGSSLLQICKQVYNCKIVCSCSNDPYKIDLVTNLGADLIIDYKNETDEVIEDKIMKFTDGKGVKCIFDCVGPSKSSLYEKILAHDSTWVLYGLLGGKKADSPQVISTLLWKRAKIIGTTLRYRSDEYKSKLISSFRDALLPYFVDGKLKPIVGNVIELDINSKEAGTKIEEAHNLMETNINRGRIVVTYK